MDEPIPSCRIDSVSSFCDSRATVDVLRLDLLHPVVSGNKWFKLKHYLAAAAPQQKTLLTFGGAFSNHLVATAAAARGKGLNSIGVVRGERPVTLSHTLREAESFGMQLFFTTRGAYKSKEIPGAIFDFYKPEDLCIVPEGGYGPNGVAGAKEILIRNKTESYTHLVAAVGTGTTLAGLIVSATETQKVIGVSAFRNNFSLEKEISELLPEEERNGVHLLHQYHFGGYAKYNVELLRFMNRFYRQTGIPTDFVYTAKTFYAVFHLIEQGYFSKGDKILLLHTGGLQGNRSLPGGSLIF